MKTHLALAAATLSVTLALSGAYSLGGPAVHGSLRAPSATAAATAKTATIRFVQADESWHITAPTWGPGIDAVIVRPVLRGGADAKTRKSFNRRITAAIERRIDAVAKALTGYETTDTNADLAATITISTAAASVYADRYVSVALLVATRLPDSQSSCDNAYYTLTYDLKKAKPVTKLGAFASKNHGQLFGEVLQAAAIQFADDGSYSRAPGGLTTYWTFDKLPPKWTVSELGLTFWSEAGRAASCAAGPAGLLVPWFKVLPPGSAKAKAKVYRRVPIYSGTPGSTATVTVRARQVKVKVCPSAGTCVTYWGVRGTGRTLRACAKDDISTLPAGVFFADVSFASTKAKARPILISFEPGP